MDTAATYAPPHRSQLHDYFDADELNNNLSRTPSIILGIVLLVLAAIVCYPLIQFPESQEARFLAIVFSVPTALTGLVLLFSDPSDLRISKQTFYLGAALFALLGIYGSLNGQIVAAIWWSVCAGCLILGKHHD